jgi:hypothetical protein
MGSLGVRVRPTGTVQLYHTRRGVIASFCSGAQSAVIQGNEIHITLKSGTIVIYEVNPSGTGVRGPVRTFT